MYSNFRRTALRWSAAFLVLMGAPSLGQALHEQQDENLLALFDIPPHLSKTAAPNLLLTFDDSARMFWGFSPGSLGRDQQQALHAVKSSEYNKLYYNPDMVYQAPRNNLGELLPNADFYAALKNPFHVWQNGLASSTSAGEYVNLSKEYEVRWNESQHTNGLRANSLAAPATAIDKSDDVRNGAAYYYSHDPALNPTLCVGSEQQRSVLNACYRYVEVGAPKREGERDERANFANWYQYHSLAVLVAKTAASELLSPQLLPASIRVGRQTVSNPGIVSGSINAPQEMVRELNAQERKNIYHWFYGIKQGAVTGSNIAGLAEAGLEKSIVTAGDFLSTSGAISPYRKEPWSINNTGDEASCRPSHHIMISSGVTISGETGSGVTSANHSVNAHVEINNQLNLPDGRVYHRDEQNQASNARMTIIENLALYYWVRDLRGDLENNIAPIYLQNQQDETAAYWDQRNDPASWQHMVTHIISPAGDDLNSVATSSRGQFVDASISTTRDENLSELASRISADRFATDGPLMQRNTTSLLQGEVLYQAQFDEEGGHLLALGTSVSLQRQCNTQFGQSSCRQAWDVADKNRQLLPLKKKIVSFDPETKRGLELSWSALSAAQKQQLDAEDGLGEQRLNFLRGDQDNEEQNGGKFKNRRSTVLGAVVNSTPLYIGNGLNAVNSPLIVHPDTLEDAAGQSYREFVCGSQGSRSSNVGENSACSSGGIGARQPMLYVASNDGLMHAYTADLEGGGEEVFSYLPSAVISKASWLSSPESGYSPMLDGVLESSDVFFNDSDKRWHTLLIGGFRTAGQAYFALDVTDPDLFSDPANAEKIVLWEFSDKDDSDLGYSFSKPVIVKSNYRGSGSYGGSYDNTGRWVVVFGNGYLANETDNHTGSGQAALFIVDVETGVLIKKILTGRGDSDKPNGLATPGVIYNDDDLKADFVYAGDLQGNMWKFDISAADPKLWAVAYGTNTLQPDSPHYSPEPLFSAHRNGQTQAITAAPIIAGHPGGQGGLIVYFGTGKYLEHSDQSDGQVQSFYALWDKNLCDDEEEEGGIISCAQAGRPLQHVKSPIARGRLLKQEITRQSGGQRSGSNHAMLWAEKQGWYIDFDRNRSDSGAAEKVLAQPLISGQLVLFSTFLPDDDACSAGGKSWLMALNKSNGGLPQLQPFDFNSDGHFDSGDYLDEQVSFGKKLSGPQFDISRVGCGESTCVLSGELTPINEGMRWGRWRWQVLSE